MEPLIVFVVAVGVATWVATDASRLGARRGRLGGGFLDMGPVGWFFACVITWLVGVVCYLIARPRLVAAQHGPTYHHDTGWRTAGSWQPPPAAYGPPAYGPPAYGPPAYGPPAYGPPTYGPPAYGAPVSQPPAAPTGMPSAPEDARTMQLRAMLEAGDINEWEFNALNQWRR